MRAAGARATYSILDHMLVRLWEGKCGPGFPITHSGNSFPLLEGTNILCRKREPFTLFAFTSKSRVPIGFDAGRIIRLYLVDRL